VKLKRSSDELRLAIDTVPAMLWSIGPDGRVDFLNRRWLEYCGLSLKEALRDPTTVLHPDDRARAIDKWHKHVPSGEPYEAELRLRRADGVYRWFLVRTVPLRDKEGKVVKWYGTSTDIETRMRSDETVRESRDLLQSVLATLPVGVAVMDPGGDILIANDASRRIWGGVINRRTERMERSQGFWPDSGKRVMREEWASALALREGRTVLEQLIEIVSYNGESRTIQNSAAPIRNSQDEIIGAVVVNEDVTTRVRAEKALRESAGRLQQLSRHLFRLQEEERRHLSRELHDEFGQLLSAISLHLQVAKGTAGATAQPSLAECIALVERAGERVRRLALELRPAMLETAAGLDGTLRWLAEQHNRQGKVTVTISGHATPVTGDVSITCFRVVQEALTNVLRHANARQVRIALEQHDHQLRITVEDDGVGFDVHAVRAQAAARGHLGLIGMRERVEILGGQLDVDSGSRSGTRISVSVPLTRRS